MKLKISNGRVIDPANHIDDQLDIFIDNGLILAVGKTPEAFIPDRIIDATDQIVCPGLVDISARLGEPSQQHASSISSETQAAIKGGITSLCIPPDTDPIIDSPAAVELLGDRANKAGSANIYIIGALTQGLEGELLSEMLALKKAGCIDGRNSDGAFNLHVYQAPTTTRLLTNYTRGLL